MNVGKALVLIDFVNELVGPNGKMAAHVVEQGAIQHARVALDYARNNGVKVIFVKVCFSEGYPELEGVDAPFYNMHREQRWLLKGAEGTEFHPDLQPIEGEPVIEKSRVNPFTNPDFEKELAGIKELAVAGVNTILAVDETVRTAAAKGYKVTVIEDACASNSAEVHKFDLDNVISKFATVVKANDYITQ